MASGGPRGTADQTELDLEWVRVVDRERRSEIISVDYKGGGLYYKGSTNMDNTHEHKLNNKGHSGFFIFYNILIVFVNFNEKVKECRVFLV